jgi:hypothetical protein
MTNVVNIYKHLYEKALERSSVHSISTTEEEISIASNLLDLSEDLSNSDSFTIETEDSLEVSDVDHFDPDYPIEIEDDEEQQAGENRRFSLEYMQRVVDFARPGIAFTTVQHVFRRVTHPMQLKRFREYVANNGNRRQKLEHVEHFVLDRFRSARNNNLPVHDLDVKRWALSKAKTENIDGFKASSYWLLNFKKRNGISSRKVTKFVSHREVVDKSIIKQTADDFVAEATKHIPKYKLDFVLNADQSGFNYEMPSNRTLSYEGEKATYLSVKSLNAISHSYTVMPIISAAGQLLSPVFICLQEPTSRFPITRAVFSASNIVTSCSTSGKLNKSLVKYWLKEVLDKVVSNRFLLMVDQWSPQADITAYENNLTKGQSCKLLVIPRKATSTKQPCDTYFFRQWKVLTKRIYRHVSLDELDVDLRSRDAIIKLQSLAHNQLSSSLFKPMISYAWSTCGYIPKQYSNFSSVTEVCFSFDADSCSNNNCEHSAFICCSHCRPTLCFEHFFTAYHFH